MELTNSITSRLHAIMSPLMNEGFFARFIVLVEGEEDRAALMAVAENLKIDLEGEGFAVISCGGKPSISRPALVFSKLGIPTYLIWDSDKDGGNPDPKLNHELLKLMGCAIEDWPKTINQRFSCFEQRLASTMKQEVGETFYDEEMNNACSKYFAHKRHAIKNAVILSYFVNTCVSKGKHFASLEKIVGELDKMTHA